MGVAADAGSRRRRGLDLGVAGLLLLFGPAISLLVLPPGYAVPALAVMGVGIALLVAGFLSTPRRV